MEKLRYSHENAALEAGYDTELFEFRKYSNSSLVLMVGYLKTYENYENDYLNNDKLFFELYVNDDILYLRRLFITKSIFEKIKPGVLIEELTNSFVVDCEELDVNKLIKRPNRMKFSRLFLVHVLLKEKKEWLILSTI